MNGEQPGPPQQDVRPDGTLVKGVKLRTKISRRWSYGGMSLIRIDVVEEGTCKTTFMIEDDTDGQGASECSRAEIVNGYETLKAAIAGGTLND